MVFIFGGAYQGKLDFAKAEFALKSMHDCSTGGEPDMEADCICNLDSFVMRCVKEGKDAGDYFRQRRDLWKDKVIIMNDVSQGIVPMDRDERAFREMNSRLMVYLAGEADRVIRVFCGIGREMK